MVTSAPSIKNTQEKQNSKKGDGSQNDAAYETQPGPAAANPRCHLPGKKEARPLWTDRASLTLNAGVLKLHLRIAPTVGVSIEHPDILNVP